MPPPSQELADIQGLLRSGYATLPEAAFLVLRITDAVAARQWLAQAPITSAAERDAATVLQVAFSAGGLRAMGLSDAIIAGFSAEFRGGMTGDPSRARRLGDVGANAPAHWRWGAQPVPDALVMLYAGTGLASWRARVADSDFHRGFEILQELPTSDMGGREPFGFADGISQPDLDWDGHRTPGGPDDLEYGNLMAAGEFLLGYRNEYGLYTDRPLLEGAEGLLPVAEDNPARRDLGRNGSYLVFRELRQDVRGFWRWLAAQTDDTAAAERLAETLVGRRLTGDPLIPVGRDGDFTFVNDTDGLRCPLGAHVRRANPRTADMPGGRQGLAGRLFRTLGLGSPDLRDDLIAPSRFHRLLRRGREFGTELPPHAAMRADAPDPRSGLHFICLNASLSRQFEFIQSAWLMSSGFGVLDSESDPLLGNRLPHPDGSPTDQFSMQEPNGVTRRLHSLPTFITPVGGAYFFLPGLRAVRFLAAGT